MVGNLLLPEIESMIKEKDFSGLKQCFSDWPPADLAELLADLPVEDQAIVFRVLPRQLASQTFEYLSHFHQRHLLQAMGQEDVARIVNQMSPDDRTALLEELPGSAVKQLLQLLNPGELAVAQTLLAYPPRSVGRLMTPDFVAVHDDWTVQQVLDYVRENGRDRETLNIIYVVDQEGKLIDDVRIREFLLRPVTAKVKDIRDNQFISLQVTDLEEEAVAIFRKYDRTALPVLDSDGKLVGIVTIDDVLDVEEQETTADIQKMGGMEALDAPYLRIGLFTMIKKRAGWLSVLFLGEMLTATAMGFFEDEIEKAVVLALFVPLIISSGGNAGSQATSLLIRAMALKDVLLKDWWTVFRRELVAGLALGSVLACIAVVRILLWPHHKQLYGPYYLLVAATVGFSLIGVVLFGSLSGSMLPFILRKLKFDPAVCSAPFVATLVDVTGLVIYFNIAMVILHGTLLGVGSKDLEKLGQEKSIQSMHRLLGLDESWEVSEVNLASKSNLVQIGIQGTDRLFDKPCARCGGKVEMVEDSSQKQSFAYPKLFQFNSLLQVKTPEGKCKKCGALYQPPAPSLPNK